MKRRCVQLGRVCALIKMTFELFPVQMILYSTRYSYIESHDPYAYAGPPFWRMPVGEHEIRRAPLNFDPGK